MSKAPIALTITSGTKGATLQRAATAGAGEAIPVSRFGVLAEARAKLGASYAAHLGVEVMARDILEAMVASGANGPANDSPQPQALADGLEAVGLISRVETVAHPHPDRWPALAQMTSGQFVLVLGQERDRLVIHDVTCTDNRTEVPLAEFEPFFTGIIVRAEAPVQQLSRAHDLPTAKAHWFWSQFAGFQRHIAEVTLGSFVANILVSRSRFLRFRSMTG